MCTYLKNFPRGARDVRMSCEREEQLKHSRSWKFLMEVFLSFSSERIETRKYWTERYGLSGVINKWCSRWWWKEERSEKGERLSIWRLSPLFLSLSKILSLEEFLVWIREKTQHSHDSLKCFFLPFWKIHKILFFFPIPSHSFYSPQSFHTLSLILSFTLSLFMVLSLSPVIPLTFIAIPVHPSLKTRTEENDSFSL